MTKGKAIGMLQKQIVKLESEDFYPKSWIIQTDTYLDQFFGTFSKQDSFFTPRYFYQDSDWEETSEQKMHSAINFLNECIDTIENIGLHKKKAEGNFLTRMPDRWAAAIVSALILISFFLGRLAYRVFDCVPCA